MDLLLSHTSSSRAPIAHSGQPSLDETNTFFDFEAWDGAEHDHNPYSLLAPNTNTGHTANSFSVLDNTETLDVPSTDDQGWASLSGDAYGLDSSMQGHDPNLFPADITYLELGPAQNWSYPATLSNSIEPDSLHEQSKVGSKNYTQDQAPEQQELGHTTPLQSDANTVPPLHDAIHEAEGQHKKVSHKPKRTRISEAAKTTLAEYFRINPYPDKTETSCLKRATQLTDRTIKTWFANTRSRAKTAVGVHVRIPESKHSIVPSPQRRSPTHSICETSLAALERISPTASMHSLQQYMDAPAKEDPISMEAVDAILRTYTGSTSLGQLSGSTLNEQAYTVVSRNGSSQRAPSLADSVGSRGTSGSHTSQNSYRSVDSRGSRRGRKAWWRAQQQPATDTDQGSHVSLVPHALGMRQSNSSLRQFSDSAENSQLSCTWPDCDSRFNYRSEWTRHEEAVHYQPYHWICCREHVEQETIFMCFVCGRRNVTVGHITRNHFTACASKGRKERTFYREDQLLQHINEVHFTWHVFKRTIQDILALWKTDNMQLLEVALKCGFCGETSRTWAERQSHVFEHFQSGYCKSSWWPERLPMTQAMVLLTGETSLTCHSCSRTFRDLSTAVHEHFECVTWSCRYLYNYRAIFDTPLLVTAGIPRAICKLCKFEICSDHQYDNYVSRLQQHAQSHNLQSCSQAQFPDLGGFIDHVMAEHAAAWDSGFSQTLFDPWRCVQKRS